MKKFKVRFVVYGVEFTSEQMTSELADILIMKLNAKGVLATFKVEMAETF